MQRKESANKVVFLGFIKINTTIFFLNISVTNPNIIIILAHHLQLDKIIQLVVETS